ncbi:hypothetical protein NG99_21070 [Erwinia typographi]|uniref:Fimbrial protein n=1 Tax=Erwinia typographi TaxID=371042 RepID=A0A0A3ZSV8_9GAMM|nr:hypothetical protein NG99_21070 [Erwinia typographi]
MKPLCRLLFSVGLMVPFAGQAELYFAPAMVASDPTMVADLSRFEKKGAQLPGDYQVDIYVNGAQKVSRTLHFADALSHGQAGTDKKRPDIHDSTGLMACLTRKDLEGLGVNVRAFPAMAALPDSTCVSPGKYIPDAFTAFDFQKMRLDISVPQASMQNSARGYIPPEQWDEGISAALLNYSFSGNNSNGRYGNSSSHYLNLNSGLNLGAWRVRDYRTWSDYDSRYYRYRKWQHVKTWAERSVIPLRSELVIGETTTSGDVFDSLGFRGVQMATDDSMYPDSRRGFAPVIRGTATTNARVTIRQNGYLVYQSNVSPGAFAIDDLYPVYSSGDLEVSVAEADGTVRVFTVPYSSLPVLQREGNFRYALTAGRYQSASTRYENPAFFQGTLVHGGAHNITTYGGVQAAEHYLAGVAGAGVNMGQAGALSADITQASSTLTDGTHHDGQSVRFLYARTLTDTGTTLQLAGYRYSTQGFHTLDETALKGMKGWLYDTDTVGPDGRPVKQSYTSYYNLYNRRRERVQATVSQQLGKAGAVHLSAVHQTYWNNVPASTSLQAGFSSQLGSVSYSLNWSHTRQPGVNGTDDSVFLSLSVPLSALLPGSRMYATYNVGRDSDGGLTHQAGLSGSALEGDNLSWNLSQGYSRKAGYSGNLSTDYRGGYGDGNLGYSYSDDYRQFSYGVSGGALLHRDGLTLGQPLGETSVLIAAPGVAGATVENEPGVHTDWRGYAIEPYASVYHENRVALDTTSLDDHTDIDNAVSRVVPTRGAVVRAEFKGHTGSRLVMTLTHNGQPVPFGAMVTAEDSTGLVGDDGQVYLSGMPAEGSVRADWGAGRSCTSRYRLPPGYEHLPVIRLMGQCR